MLTRIHVNGQHLRHNKKNPKSGVRKPVFTAKNWKQGNRKGNLVVVQGPSRIVYSPDDPMKSGAVAWIETEANVEVFE